MLHVLRPSKILNIVCWAKNGKKLVLSKSLKFPLFYNIKVTNFTKKTAQKIIKTERCGVQKILVVYFLRENKSLLISYELHIFWCCTMFCWHTYIIFRWRDNAWQPPKTSYGWRKETKRAFIGPKSSNCSPSHGKKSHGSW